jgi:hypothetical protein
MRPALVYQTKTEAGRAKVSNPSLSAGFYLCQWMVTIGKEQGPVGKLSALREIPTLGFIPKGEWDIPPAFPLAKANQVVLVSLPKDCDFWFESEGYWNGSISFYRYQPITASSISPVVATINNPPLAIDLTPLANAIQIADTNASNNAATIQGQLGQLVAAGQPATNSTFVELRSQPWQGGSLGGKFLGFDAARRTVTFTVPAMDTIRGQPNTHPVRICKGTDNRPQADDYDWTVYPGGSIDINGDDAAQQLCCWQDTNTTATYCNLTITTI